MAVSRSPMSPRRVFASTRNLISKSSCFKPCLSFSPITSRRAPSNSGKLIGFPSTNSCPGPISTDIIFDRVSGKQEDWNNSSNTTHVKIHFFIVLNKFITPSISLSAAPHNVLHHRHRISPPFHNTQSPFCCF
jgi:hypothetical protein